MIHIFSGGEVFRSLVFLFTLPPLVLAFLLTQIDQWKSAKPLFFPELFYGVSTLIGATNILVPYLLLIAWGSIYLALTQNEEMKITIGNSQNLQNLTRKSEQRALRYQLNPHFIFNALNSVSSLVVDHKNEQAERLVDELADYMRVVLDDEGQEMVTVVNEIAQQARYLEIEKVRFPDRLYYETNIAEGVEKLRIPALIIQPLVENAVKHGVARSSSKVTITIEASIEKDRLKISVCNTGRMKVTKPDGDAIGTGLVNIADRLKVIYGPTAALVVGNSDEAMAVATIIIPIDRPRLRTLMR
ncbi:MAG: histidine kinase [Parasphingorhabdus sp.]